MALTLTARLNYHCAALKRHWIFKSFITTIQFGATGAAKSGHDRHRRQIMTTLPSYDLVPYESMPAAATHPDRMTTLGRLFGLDPAPVTDCRVLELGCADGGNLMPMGFNLPGSTFVGIDLSAKQIQTGRRRVKDLGLKNVSLEHAGLADVDDSMGRFDYIICHGVYSWVTEELQDRILEICANNLVPRGLAYIDYNTYPGWASLETVRKLMKLHAEGLDEPAAVVRQALSAADLMARFITGSDKDYAAHIKNEIEKIIKVGRRPEGVSYIYHEYLEDVNRPVYFQDFAARIRSHGLEYVTEAIYANTSAFGFPPVVGEIMSNLGDDVVQVEQYMDFLRNRRFRQSIVCHADARPLPAARRPDPAEFLAACTAKVTAELIESSEAGTPAQAALLRLLEVRPRAVRLDVLFNEVMEQPRFQAPDSAGRRRLLDAILSDFMMFYASNAVQLFTWQADFVLTPGDRPRLTELALFQARSGQRWLANQVHEPAILPLVLLDLASGLDGSLTHDDLADVIRERSVVNSDGSAPAGENSKPLTAEDAGRAADEVLQELAGKALLAE